MRNFKDDCISTVVYSLMITLCWSMANAELIEETCEKISHKDPNIKYAFCVSTFNSDPRSSSATTMAELGSISFEIDIARAKSTVSTINGLLKDPKYDPSTNSALKDCLELYSDASDDLEEGFDALKSGDLSTANIRASAAMDSGDTCEKGFKESKKPSPLAKENADFFQLVAISLSFTV